MNKQYEHYKASGIEWIGEIPEHWDLVKANWLFRTVSSGTTPSTQYTKYYENGDTPWIITGDLNNSEIHDTSNKISKKALEDYPTLILHSPDSIVIAMYGATIGKLGVTKIKAATNQACCVFSDPLKGNARYYFYWFLSNKEEIISLGKGGGQPNISQSILRNIRLTVPPQNEQTTIANYLDEKTSQIDRLIDIAQKEIDRLQEYRTALINQVVTKGLDPNVPMKDSGIEWIGEIPEHWNLIKSNWLFNNVSSGTTPSTQNQEYYKGADIPWIVTGDLNNSELTNTTNKISSKALKDYPTLFLHPQNSIVVAMYGATIGKLAITKIEATTNQACCVFSNPSIGDPRYYFYWFLSKQQEIISLSKGGGQPNISQSILKNIGLTVPNKEEQQEIANFLDQKTSLLKQDIKKEEKRIQKLQEYRQTLISEVVTGKKKVVKDKETEPV